MADLRVSSNSTPQVYVRPALKVFGQIGALTQSGTMVDTEMTMPNGNCGMSQRSMC